MKVKVKSLSLVQLFETLWTVASQAPLQSLLGKNTGVGCHFSSPGDLSDPVIELRSPALQADSLPSEPPGNLIYIYTHTKCFNQLKAFWLWSHLDQQELLQAGCRVFSAQVRQCWIAYLLSSTTICPGFTLYISYIRSAIMWIQILRGRFNNLGKNTKLLIQNEVWKCLFRMMKQITMFWKKTP